MDKGGKKEYIAGYLNEIKTSPIPPKYRFSMSFRFKVIGRIKLYNLHVDYEQYKRKQISFLSVLADIAALFSAIKGILVKLFKYYSKKFDNYRVINNILSKKLKNNSSPSNNGNNEQKDQFMPLNNDFNINYINDNLSNTNEHISINENDELSKNDNRQLKKIGCLHYNLNNIYCKKLHFNVQDRIEICNEIVKKYMSYENILYNQLILEKILLDYNWNNSSLKEINNNQLIIKLKNLDFDST